MPLCPRLFTSQALYAVCVFNFFCMILGPGIAWSQSSTSPETGIVNRAARLTVLQNAKVVISPTEELQQADLLIRDNQIVEVAKQIAVPPGAEQIDCTGKVLYAAFIDPFVEQAIPVASRPDAHWNSRVLADRHASSAIPTDEKLLADYRRAGIGALLVVPSDGLFKGTSALITTAALPPTQTLQKSSVFQHMTLVLAPGQRGSYPNSPMGTVALARQTLSDAQWYQQSLQALRADPSLPTLDKNAALAALEPVISGQQALVMDAGNELYALRADRLAREFNVRAVLRGSGREYRRMDAIASTNRTIIVPVDFPKAPDVASVDAAMNVSLQALMHWYLAPENPGRLEKAKVPFVLTSYGLSKPGDLLDSVRKAIERGLSPSEALDALTLRSARLLEVDKTMGTLQRGKLANIIVASGSLWDKKTTIEETWVQGHRYRWKKQLDKDPSGQWQLTLTGPEGLPEKLMLTLESMADKPKGRLGREMLAKVEADKPNTDSTDADDAKQDKQSEKEDATEKKDDEGTDKPKESDKSSATKATESKSPSTAELKSLSIDAARIDAHFDESKLIAETSGIAAISLTMIHEDNGDINLSGRILWHDGRVSVVQGTKLKKDANPSSDTKTATSDASKIAKSQSTEKETKSNDAETICEVNYPLGAFGVDSQTPPEQPAQLLIRGATLWTCTDDGLIESGDMLIANGIITKVGKNLEAPEGCKVIDAKGKHVSPGIIDCHSHMATDGGVNESGQAVTAEVRVGDFVDANDITIYLQLAGGVTTANILHGSANPIGGQNQVIKLRWGALDEEMKMREAPPGIKFALGENVKQSNLDRSSGRYPQSRMGVEQIMRDRFEAALLYRKAQQDPAGLQSGARKLPHRRDYELETIAEILEKKRWIHCHSYRQDEILTFLRLLERYGVTVGSLQHILEGYKVADAMARHGATGSTFSDWWTYKMEVVDAIPYNGALMHRMGVIVSFNSDDDELARHLNHEAAKAIKYGNVPPMEALKFVTLNPAKQLRIDQYVGSLAPGKQADFVIWSSSPLSTLSRCEQTWIDGRKYFDREDDAKKRQEVEQLHRKLVQKVLGSGEKGTGDGRDRRDPSYWFKRYDEFCSHSNRDADQDLVLINERAAVEASLQAASNTSNSSDLETERQSNSAGAEQ